MKESDMRNLGIAGNYGEKIRSDCRVTLDLSVNEGISIELNSKVESMFGKSIQALARDMFDFYDIRHAKLLIEDSGALPFVLTARIEAAIKQLSNTRKEYFLPDTLIHEPSAPERFRMSRLYVPGNSPSMMINAGIHGPNGVIFDLEDSVAPDKKDEARILVRNALRTIDLYGAERMARINQLPLGLEDAAILAAQPVDLLLIPKCEESWQIHKVEEVIANVKDSDGNSKVLFLMPIIESALGVENAFELARASKNIVAMAIGLEDLTADLGVSRTAEGKETLYARTRMVNACKAAGIQAIDSVYSDIGNTAGLIENVRISRSLGFEGMGCIHPRQVPVIHEGFMPGSEEIEKSMQILDAYKEAREKGLGVVALGTKMIDAPVVKRAEKTLELARKFHMI